MNDDKLIWPETDVTDITLAKMAGDDKPAPQFGEPWTLKADSPALFIIENNNKNQVLVSNEYYDDKGWIENADEAPDLHEAQRIVACVNAMANIPDPQGFVEEVRKLLEDCHDGFDWLQDGHDCCTAFPLKQRISAMLARLDAGRGRE